jgi:hypothetical protein
VAVGLLSIAPAAVAADNGWGNARTATVGITRAIARRRPGMAGTRPMQKASTTKARVLPESAVARPVLRLRRSKSDAQPPGWVSAATTALVPVAAANYRRRAGHANGASMELRRGCRGDKVAQLISAGPRSGSLICIRDAVLAARKLMRRSSRIQFA